MPQYVQARKNMIDCQLATNGIIEPYILDAFSKVPREYFLPKNLYSIAYTDEDIVLGGGKFFMEPMVQARLIQASAPKAGDAVLNIGDVTGYMSAILSGLVSTVVTLEKKAGQFDRVRAVWDDLGFCNIAVVQGEQTAGCPEHKPYDLIFINGAVDRVPDEILDQLADGGRLVTVLGAPGSIMLVEKIADGKFSTQTLQDCTTFYAAGFEPSTSFVF